jgi:hypothetical protein
VAVVPSIRRQVTNFPAGPDVLNQKFIGKERDAETGLDYSTGGRGAKRGEST